MCCTVPSSADLAGVGDVVGSPLYRASEDLG